MAEQTCMNKKGVVSIRCSATLRWSNPIQQPFCSKHGEKFPMANAE